jgi:hypothetical protein
MSYFRNKAVARQQLGLDGSGIVAKLDAELGSTDWRSAMSGEDISDALDTYLDQTAWRRQHMADFRDYGALPSGPDCTAALNAAIADTSCTSLYIPGANWWFSSQPNPIDRALEIIGESMSDSVFVATHTDSILNFQGSSGGGALRNLNLGFSTSGGNSTAGILMTALANGTSPDFLTLENIVITGYSGSTMDYGFIADGNLRTSGTVGIRNLSFSNVHIFNTTTAAFEMRHARVCSLHEIRCFVGSGSTNAALITGANAGTQSDTVFLSNSVMGDLTMDYCQRGLGSNIACAALEFTTNAVECNVRGAATSVTNNGTGCFSSMA